MTIWRWIMCRYILKRVYCVPNRQTSSSRYSRGEKHWYVWEGRRIWWGFCVWEPGLQHQDQLSNTENVSVLVYLKTTRKFWRSSFYKRCLNARQFANRMIRSVRKVSTYWLSAIDWCWYCPSSTSLRPTRYQYETAKEGPAAGLS